MGHGVLDILLDESTEPDVLKSRGLRIGVGRTVFPKFDNLIAEIAKEYAGQEMEGKASAVVSFNTLFPFFLDGSSEPDRIGDGEVGLPCGVMVERPDWFNPILD